MTTAINAPNRASAAPTGRAAKPVLMGYAPARTLMLRAATVLSLVLMLGAIGMALFYAGTDSVQGNVQRIFYMHVGSFSAAFIALFTTVIAGLLFLITRSMRWDKLALAGVQVGLPLATITLITGAVWARPTWNTWWTRDPRLDSMIVMWAVYAAYLVLRSALHAPEQRARFSAVYGIFAFVSVIYVTIVIRIRPDTLHPIVIAPELSQYLSTTTLAKGLFALNADPRIGRTLGFASVAWTVLALTLIWHFIRLANLTERANALKMRLAERES
jgi:heme exporter protein C